jgi:hypothetical protein
MGCGAKLFVLGHPKNDDDALNERCLAVLYVKVRKTTLPAPSLQGICGNGSVFK